MKPGRKPKLNEAQLRWLGERYKEGYYIAELAKAAGIGRNNLSLHLARLGYLPQDREFLEPIEDRMEEFYELGIREE